MEDGADRHWTVKQALAVPLRLTPRKSFLQLIGKSGTTLLGIFSPPFPSPSVALNSHVSRDPYFTGRVNPRCCEQTEGFDRSGVGFCLTIRVRRLSYDSTNVLDSAWQGGKVEQSLALGKNKQTSLSGSRVVCLWRNRPAHVIRVLC